MYPLLLLQKFQVNYQGLVPVLINALKEQDEKINRLEKLVEKLIDNRRRSNQFDST